MSNNKLNFDFKNTNYEYIPAPNNMDTWKQINSSGIPNFTNRHSSYCNTNTVSDSFSYTYDTYASCLATQIYNSTERIYNNDLCS